MKKTMVVMAVMALAAICGQGWAGTSDSITVTVSLTEEVSVSLDLNTWNIGPVILSGTSGPETFTATNDGNVAIDIDIAGTDAAGGWLLAAAAGSDAFAVDVNSSFPLSTSDQALDSNVGTGATSGIDLTYGAPTADTKGGGVDQSFSVTVSASKYVP